MWTKVKLTPYEAEQKWLPGEKEFMGGVYERIGALAGREHIHDLSGVFGTSESRTSSTTCTLRRPATTSLPRPCFHTCLKC